MPQNLGYYDPLGLLVADIVRHVPSECQPAKASSECESVCRVSYRRHVRIPSFNKGYKYVGSADCVATRLLAPRFCEPRRALRTSTKGNRVHEATAEDCTKGSAKAQDPTNPQGLHEGLRESQAPARTHANSKLLATQSGDPFCFALIQNPLLQA